MGGHPGIASDHALQWARSFAAGLLLQRDRKDMGHVKSAVLLLARLLMGTLFLFVGYTQAGHIPQLLGISLQHSSTHLMFTIIAIP